MTRHKRLLAVAVMAGLAIAVTATGSAATPGDTAGFGDNSFRESLVSYAETPVALSTPGKASLRLQINDRAQEITWRLSYADLSADVTQAHIHFGNSQQTGGVSFFFCSNLGNGPAGTQACPAAPATVSGTIKPVDVVGPAAQGIAAGEFGEIVAAIRAGFTYANVHTTAFPGGEVRAQLGHQH
jgi:hypothetical protein